MSRPITWRNLRNAFQTNALAAAFIIGTFFIESCAVRLDLQQIYGNGRAMRQKLSSITRCIINAS
jgi:hypothetical protein